MRRLTMKQKNYIIDIVKRDGFRYHLTNEEIDMIEKFNDYETAHQDAHRFLGDLILAFTTGAINNPKWVKEWR